VIKSATDIKPGNVSGYFVAPRKTQLTITNYLQEIKIKDMIENLKIDKSQTPEKF
jgi:hypothetical protein